MFQFSFFITSHPSRDITIILVRLVYRGVHPHKTSHGIFAASTWDKVRTIVCSHNKGESGQVADESAKISDGSGRECKENSLGSYIRACESVGQGSAERAE